MQSEEPSAIPRRDPILSPAAAAAAGVEPRPSTPAGDHLVMLGTGGGPVLNRFNTQTAIDLIVAGSQYLIDCGAGAPRRIVEAGMGFANLRHVFVTHHHLDHLAGYPELLVLGSSAREVDVWGPPPIGALHEGLVGAFAHSVELFDGRSELGSRYRLHEVTLPEDGIASVMEDDNARVSATRVFHGAEVRDAYAYRFDVRRTGRSVVVSGDTAGPNEQLIELARDADILIHEVQLNARLDLILDQVHASRREALRRHLVTTHTDVADIPRVARAANVKRVVMCHYVPAFLPPEAFLSTACHAAGAVGYEGEIVAPADLDVIVL
jgi:ribonuclease BN (tRNA processing enzyme)